VPNKIWLAFAWAWTVFVAVLCLVRLTDLPKVDIQSPDKYVHAIFHFVFVLLWSQYFRQKKNDSGELWNLTRALVSSIVFGGLIELAQEIFTATRSADLKDVMANFAGAALAVLLQAVTILLVKRKRQ